MIDFMALRKTERLTLLAEEVVWQREPHAPQTIIAKMTRFFWEIRYIEAETTIFEHLAALNIGLKFLGHVHENGRVIDFALEKLLDQRPAGPDDVAACRAELGRMHSHGILHGDVNRYNFLIGGDGAATPIDFEKSQLGADKAALDKEMAGLERELRDESGQGGGFMEEEEGVLDEEYEKKQNYNGFFCAMFAHLTLCCKPMSHMKRALAFPFFSLEFASTWH